MHLSWKRLRLASTIIDNMSLFEIKNCKKSFNGIKVLDDINVKVNEGEVVAIIGSSGSGKTTLLRILLRLSAIQRMLSIWMTAR